MAIALVGNNHYLLCCVATCLQLAPQAYRYFGYCGDRHWIRPASLCRRSSNQYSFVFLVFALYCYASFIFRGGKAQSRTATNGNQRWQNSFRSPALFYAPTNAHGKYCYQWGCFDLCYMVFWAECRWCFYVLDVADITICAIWRVSLSTSERSRRN